MNPMTSARPRLCRACTATLIVLAGCGGTDPSPSTGTMRVTVSTSGVGSDPDGYTLTVNGDARTTFARSGETTITDLGAGVVPVGLSGVSDNCTVEGQNPRSVTITAGLSITIAFIVTCGPVTGTIQVTTSTSGPEPDPDGYTYGVDGDLPVAIPANASVQITSLVVGNHTVTLAGLANNCTLTGTASRTVAVSASSTSTVTFEVTCAAQVGTIRVTTASTGRAPDPDGFTILVDGVARALPGNGSTTISDVPVGSRSISLAGVAENCTVTSHIPSTVGVTYQGTADINVEALCPGTLAGRILFVGLGPYLFSMAPDGTDREQVTASPSTYTLPVVSPDGQVIVYNAFDANSFPRIYALRYDGKNKTMLSPQTVCAEEPAWSPTGARIAFNQCDDNTIWVMNADGTNAHRVTPVGTSGDFSPSWSPDGTRLVFAHNGSLGVMNANGSGRATFDLGVNVSLPRWSPDGARILFTGNSIISSEGDIYTVGPDGTDLVRLTMTGVSIRARWSPDGQRITYGQSGAESGVYTMQADGSLQTRISGASIYDHDPTWVE